MYIGDAMKPTEVTKRHVIATYVEPARSKGEKTIQVRVGNVQKELGWTNRTPSVFSTLLSRGFQRDAGVELVEKKGGPASGGPSTSVEFTFRVLQSEAEGQSQLSSERPKANGKGLLAMYGILADAYRKVGGGEAFLKSERAAWGLDPWEKLAMEVKVKTGKGE
jgi:hypothetical protein